MNPEQENTISRKDLIYMTKIYTKANRFEEAIEFSLAYIELNPVLTNDERNLFVTAFKNQMSKKRSAWRKIHNNEKKVLKEDFENNVKSKNPKNDYLKEIKHKIEKELRTAISLMLNALNNYLLPPCEENPESAVFYLKLKGDYCRYLSEITGGEDREGAIAEAEDNYNTAYHISEETLPITSVTRLGLCLNYSVFLWEVKLMQQEAALVAQNAFNQVIDRLEDLEKIKAKDAILIIQLLKENLMMWSKEIVDDGEEEEGGVMDLEEDQEMMDGQNYQIS
mmetsp:Transcript_4257/g.4394  ORF Transcript_4257/g.4394 Transcript_4257/m.4394 type:complete len:280 (+) Transcript_4257:3-842(+)